MANHGSKVPERLSQEWRHEGSRRTQKKETTSEFETGLLVSLFDKGPCSDVETAEEL